MKKMTILLMLLLVQIAGARSQSLLPRMPLDSAKVMLERAAYAGLETLDSSTARVIINTLLYYSVSEKVKAYAQADLTYVQNLIIIFSPSFDDMTGVLNDKENEILLKDKILLEDNIKSGFPSLKNYSANECLEYLLKNYQDLKTFMLDSDKTKAIFGSTIRNNDDGLINALKTQAENNSTINHDYTLLLLLIIGESDFVFYEGVKFNIIDYFVNFGIMTERYNGQTNSGNVYLYPSTFIDKNIIGVDLKALDEIYKKYRFVYEK
jgi:hypothetical protein